ncbi:hypothetical protein Taro_043453, partial [Colocasia esculenta]|nr:hypothetical protein [Colocasia esculenta]
MSVTELKERHVAATAAVNALRERLRQRREMLLDTDRTASLFFPLPGPRCCCFSSAFPVSSSPFVFPGGQQKSHLLTSGWSVFVGAKWLKAGDSVVFIRLSVCALEVRELSFGSVWRK